LRFEHKLAVALGRTVAELRQSMSSEELSRWLAYDQTDLLPDPWFIGAQVCAVLAAAFGRKGYRPKVEDFIPRASGVAVKIASGEEGRAFFRGLSAAMVPAGIPLGD
jgi:hypothetical protein